MKTLVFRHGISNYLHGNRFCKPEEFETIEDLKPEGVIRVLENAQAAATRLVPAEKIAMRFSPIPRCVHSARLIRDVLLMECFSVDWLAEEEIREVGNFSWVLFKPLFDGGTFDWEGAQITIDKADTNPKGLDYAAYFNEDVLHDLPLNVLAKMPASYVQKILLFEKSADVNRRVLSFFGRHMMRPEQTSIVVTHDSNVGHFARHFTGNKKSGLEPGNFLVLERKGADTIILEVEGQTEGNKEPVFKTE